MNDAPRPSNQLQSVSRETPRPFLNRSEGDCFWLLSFFVRLATNEKSAVAKIPFPNSTPIYLRIFPLVPRLENERNDSILTGRGFLPAAWMTMIVSQITPSMIAGISALGFLKAFLNALNTPVTPLCIISMGPPPKDVLTEVDPSNRTSPSASDASRASISGFLMTGLFWNVLAGLSCAGLLTGAPQLWQKRTPSSSLVPHFTQKLDMTHPNNDLMPALYQTIALLRCSDKPSRGISLFFAIFHVF